MCLHFYDFHLGSPSLYSNLYLYPKPSLIFSLPDHLLTWCLISNLIISFHILFLLGFLFLLIFNISKFLVHRVLYFTSYKQLTYFKEIPYNLYSFWVLLSVVNIILFDRKFLIFYLLLALVLQNFLFVETIDVLLNRFINILMNERRYNTKMNRTRGLHLNLLYSWCVKMHSNF